MSLTLFVSRFYNWFDFEDSKLSPYFCAVLLLQRLSTRRSKGLDYDRFSLIQLLIERKGQSALKALDAAIVILFSRKLIMIDELPNFKSKLMITEAGLLALEKYNKELKNAN